MVKTHRGTWLALGIVGAVLVAAVGWLTAAGMARAGVSSLGIGSDTVEPGGEVTVSVSAVATAPGIGAYEIKVVYDNTLVDATACTSNPVGVCNKDYGADTVFFSGASGGGLTGSAELGTITFQAGDTEGEAALDVQVDQLTDPTAVAIEVTADDGTITIAVPIADADGDTVPDDTDNCPDDANADQADEDADGVGDACEEATPTPSATPVVTPAAPIAAGGPPADGSGWLLAAVLGLGLAALGSAAWVTARRRQSL